MFIRLACPAVRSSDLSSGGEHSSGGLLRRSRLPLRRREMPLVALARTGMLDRDAGLSTAGGAIEATRLATGTELWPTRLILRGFLDAMALRSLCMSIVLDSESDPEAFGGLFSSMTACS